MNICITVTPDGQVGGGWGRAERVAVAKVANGKIESWDEIDVGWGRLHDAEAEGMHHARIVTFLREHEIQTVIAGHMGPGMQQTLAKMGIAVRIGATGDARAAVLAAVPKLN